MPQSVENYNLFSPDNKRDEKGVNFKESGSTSKNIEVTPGEFLFKDDLTLNLSGFLLITKIAP
jgi:hypothetical protein